MSQTESYYGSGTVYIKRRGVAGAPRVPIGNCSKLTLAVAEESKEQPNYEGGGGLISKVTRIKSVTASITADSFSASNIALALRGTVDANPDTAAIVDEAHDGIATGSLIVTRRLPDLGLPLVVEVAGTPVAEEGNYERKRSGIYILPDAAGLIDGADIKVSYTPLADDLIEALTDSGAEYELVFDGLNEAASGKPSLITGYRAIFSPTKALDALGDNFGSLQIEAALLADESVTGTGKSRYFTVRKGR